MLLDLHTHHTPPQSEGIISLRWPVSLGACEALSDTILPDQKYSVGLHPWDTAHMGAEYAVSGFTPESLALFSQIAERPEIAAIGESGLDKLQGGILAAQINALRTQVAVSEQLAKPLILHSVRCDDMILSLHRSLAPAQAWAMHGYRGKPQAAAQLATRGIYISFGEKFNEATLQLMLEQHPGQVLAETDESPLDIHQIIDRLSAVAGYDLTDTIAANLNKFLGLTGSSQEM